ncbi:SRPBCC family protein [Mariniphaga sediminis]|jgi:carbon monoxide dehydrogenase subunit G|uniref:SRPBCC family protein n=1 Tax=Mariniphaga sediminis TaxID=1628158 RepID=A0A399DA12_9BACT|nr:SRPBCC family protein [Mariniphaga sediminis]RIH66890.1 SRPBCC family protein [Mariniphaga sediminis]
MAINKYISNVKLIDHNQQIVFDYLANFENLSEYLNSGLLEKITKQVPQVKISNFESDQDSCRFNITGMGLAEIRVVNREPHKTIKVESSGGLPMSFTFWIQLLPVSAFQTKIRLTLHADLNMMIKMMVGNKLEEGINQLAETLATLPYK